MKIDSKTKGYAMTVVICLAAITVVNRVQAMAPVRDAMYGKRISTSIANA